MLIALTVIVVALVYMRGWWRLRSGLPYAVSVWRPAAFIVGLLSLWAAVGSPLAALDHHFLTAHMVQHLLLMTVAAPLILLGAPVIALLHVLPRLLVPSSRSTLARSLGSVVAHPISCWLAGTGAVIGWHVPALFELGMRTARWHAIETICFITAGLLFWWPVVQPWPSLATWPRWGIPVYLFLATLPCDVLSAFLTFCGRAVYPHYATSSLTDQERAGALMWVWVTFVYLVPAAVITIQLLSPRHDELPAAVENSY